jgi:hypothetical protein
MEEGQRIWFIEVSGQGAAIRRSALLMVLNGDAVATLAENGAVMVTLPEHLTASSIHLGMGELLLRLREDNSALN